MEGGAEVLAHQGGEGGDPEVGSDAGGVACSPTRGLEVLALAAAAPADVGEEDVELVGSDGGDSGLVVASAVVASNPNLEPPTAAEQGAIIARQQAEIVSLREIVQQQAAAIEQLRRAASSCQASAPGTSPPPLYGPASPSTELVVSEDLDELSPTGRHHSQPPLLLQHPSVAGTLSLGHAAMHSHAAIGAAHSLAAYAASYGSFGAPGADGRPASAASAATLPARAPPTPKHAGKQPPRTPPSHHSLAGEVGHADKRFRAATDNLPASAAPSTRGASEPALPFASVTLSLLPFKTTVSGPTKVARPGGRTNTHVLWTPEEDACLRQLVQEHGEQAWALVASRMPHERNNKQCRERWRNHLRPACNKGPWTEEEDRLILERVQQHGTKWAKISGLYLPDRPENDIKNRWHILIRLHNHSQNGQPHAPLPPALAAEVAAGAP